MKLILDLAAWLLGKGLIVVLVVVVFGVSAFGVRKAKDAWQEFQNSTEQLQEVEQESENLTTRQQNLDAERRSVTEMHNAEQRSIQAQIQALEERQTSLQQSLSTSARDLQSGGAGFNRTLTQLCRDAGGSEESCNDRIRQLASDSPEAMLAQGSSWVSTMCEPRRIGSRVVNWLTGCKKKQESLEASLASMGSAVSEFNEHARRINHINNQINHLNQSITSVLSPAQREQLNQIDQNQADLERDRTKLERRRAAIERRDEFKREVKEEWSDFKKQLPRWILIALGILFLPWLLRVLKYFVLAPWVSRARPVRLLKDEELEVFGTPQLHTEDLGRQATIPLRPGQKLSIRHDYVRSSQGGRSSLLYGGLRHPFTSYAAGLKTMTTFTGTEDPINSQVTLASTANDGADRYLLRLSLKDHPGFTLYPSHLVALAPDPNVPKAQQLAFTFRWSFRLVNFMSGRFRYLIVKGSGDLYLEGGGAITAQQVPERTQLETRYYVGYDARMQEGIARNENAWAFLFSKEHDLFETRLLGEELYIWEKSPMSDKRPLLMRVIDPILNAIGKILGI